MSKKFLFTTSFDGDDEKKESPSDNLATPSVSPQDDGAIKDIKIQSYSEGFSAGLEEGYVQGELKAVREKYLHFQSVLYSIHQGIEKVIDNDRHFNDHITSKIISLSLVIFDQLFPNLLKENAAAEMKKTVEEVLTAIVKPSAVRIIIHPSFEDELKENLESLMQRFDGTINIETNENNKFSECKIFWDGGHARWCGEEILEKIKEILINNQNM